jgi:hypothetical protein
VSSGTPSDPQAVRGNYGALASAAVPGSQTAGRMSPRQLELNRRYAYFRCENYDHCTVDWNGDPIVPNEEGAAIARSRDVPPGFYDPGGQMMPLRFRRPDAPYYLGKVVVKRFTGLLFSHSKHPKIRVQGDPLTEDWLDGAVEAGRLWAEAIQLRDMGGATGSGPIGFSFQQGEVRFEMFDPRYSTPVFKNRLTRELESIEVRWSYQDSIRDIDGKGWVSVEFLGRRVIDETSDTLWQDVPAPTDGGEPNWDDPRWAPTIVEHNFGECPVEWIQNEPVAEQVDGNPDCHGGFDMIERIDVLTSQANRGVIANCDPTLVLATDDDAPPALRKGSDNFISVGKGEDVKYLEITGAGPRSAIEQADRLEEKFLRLVQCVIENARSRSSTKTATEVVKDYSSMHEKVDVLREQYGPRGLGRLLAKLVRAAQTVSARTSVDESGRTVREEIFIPPRVEIDAEGKTRTTERKLGPGGPITFQWPPYDTPQPQDVEIAVRSAVSARDAGLLDDEHAAQSIAPFYGVENVRAMLTVLAQKKADEEAAFAAQTVGQATAPVAEIVYTRDELEAGLVTINEWRANKGLATVADGELTVPAYRAKYAQLYAQNTLTQDADGAEKILGMGEGQSDAAQPMNADGSSPPY